MSDNQSEQGIAFVTGAAGGMGSHIASRLHSDGYRVVLSDIAFDKAQDIAMQLSPDGSTAIPLELDVSHKSGFVDALVEVQRVWGTPDVLVNNAAITRAADLMTLAEDDFAEVLTTNVNSIFFGCQVFGAAMADQQYGRIVNMASLAGQNGGTGTGAHYASSKGAILTITKIFAKEFASAGVTVNAIAPGPHDLPIVTATMTSERLAAVLSSIPARRLGSPSFIADMVALLAQRNAFFVTGACWDVNGGLYFR
ncbi:SDR family NAD(P)-dependent oxidoreductase [Mycobacterium kyogaense]|uniref:SDR family NAD(P)-dependent oxidoreductase n=1 Tax=Mycobacterium kyogaense TaxID=2212479 RepID=UPI000DACF3DE|nr:SDR family oxidoreductase [Mycobacterium kyogaense]